MSTPLSAATAASMGSSGTTVRALSRMKSQQEQLTFHLRALASELDGLDRRLADLEWHQRRHASGTNVPESSSERSALESQREHLTCRLRGLARELSDLDSALASWNGHPPASAPRVGICPDCGYPSLDSGLCAFCRPRLA